MRRRRRKLLPAPPPLPEGKMYFYGSVVSVEDAEYSAKRQMAGFDDLPRRARMVLNGVGSSAILLKAEANARFKGDLVRAADRLLIDNASLIVKVRKRKAAR